LLGAKFDVDAGLGACPSGWTGTISLGESLRAIAVLESGASNSGTTHGGAEVDVVASSMRLVQVTTGTENLPREAEIQSHLACYPGDGITRNTPDYCRHLGLSAAAQDRYVQI
jgi:hypothetical protein